MRRLLALVLLLASSCRPDPDYDLIIRRATVYDGMGSMPFEGDIAINADTIAVVGVLQNVHGRKEINATGLAAAPGFINMLSWANESLLQDGRSQSDIRQGVTLEVMGEGWSMGPLNGEMRRQMREEQGDIRYEVAWSTLGGYLDHLVAKGVSTNVASFVGATTVRVYALGYADREPTTAELDTMRALVAQAMEEGALGVASSLIYAPAFYAKTGELVELAKAAGSHGGMYISHMRSEGDRLLEALDELLLIAREAGVPAEVYHLKAAGSGNWWKMDSVIARIERARMEGLRITADMYMYEAAATGLDASMPPWVQEGGFKEWKRRLQDPALRRRVAAEMSGPADGWENLLQAAGSPDKVLLVGFRNDTLKHLTGKSLAEVAAMRGTPPAETAMDLVVQDDSRVATVYFLMTEENLRKQVALPWMSFCSDAESLSPEGPFLKSNPHPRAYGNVARLLGRYVREEGTVRLEEAIRRLTSHPASVLAIPRRGSLAKGNFADVVLFDPGAVRDEATYADPHRFAAGVRHVFVNGVQVLEDGDHTGATPGRVVRGPGWKGAGTPQGATAAR
jgi:N-acyl-D-amino-acid deacylase